MLASIIITNYNYGTYLAEAIDSALNQDYPSVEVIVVDDGSTDHSAQVISSYGSRIHPIFRENGGQCASFNTGFSEARGDVIAFLDADDVLFADAIQSHVDRFRDPTVVKSNGQLQVVDRELRPIGGVIPAALADSGDYLERFLQAGPSAYRSSLTSGNAWSREFLSRVLPLPSDPFIGADGLLTAIDPLFGRIESIGRPIGAYRLHGCNKGPQNPVYGTEYLKKALKRYERRMAYAKSWTRELGYEFDAAQWDAQQGWRLALVRHVLFLSGVENSRVGFRELVVEPVRKYDHDVINRMGLATVLTVAGLLPEKLSLMLSHYVLKRAFMKRRKRMSANPTPGKHEIDMHFLEDS